MADLLVQGRGGAFAPFLVGRATFFHTIAEPAIAADVYGWK